MSEEEQHRSLGEILLAALREADNVSNRHKVDEKLLAAHKCSSHHRLQIVSSTLCGCFSCLTTFPAAEIEEWTDGVDTAICPICGIDAVLGEASGFPITKDFLSDMCLEWFGFLPGEELQID